MSENIGRNIIFIIVFLSSFALLLAMMPSSFLIAHVNDLETITVPNKWYASALATGEYALFDQDVIPYGTTTDLTLGSIDLHCKFMWSTRGREIRLDRLTTVFFFIPWEDSLLIDNKFYIGLDTIHKYRVSGNLTSMIMKDSKFIYHVSISYNSTRFANFEEAWNNENGEVLLFIGITVNDSESVWTESTNVFNLISQILFFQNPYIHPAINAFIALPIWISVAYLVIRLILWAISAPLGGGG